jgi:hypothetical protein
MAAVKYHEPVALSLLFRSQVISKRACVRRQIFPRQLRFQAVGMLFLFSFSALKLIQFLTSYNHPAIKLLLRLNKCPLTFSVQFNKFRITGR